MRKFHILMAFGVSDRHNQADRVFGLYGIERKPFAFTPESLFAISLESYSPSARNAFRVHPGILFAFPRNPHESPSASGRR